MSDQFIWKHNNVSSQWWTRMLDITENLFLVSFLITWTRIYIFRMFHLAICEVKHWWACSDSIKMARCMWLNFWLFIETSSMPGLFQCQINWYRCSLENADVLQLQEYIMWWWQKWLKTDCHLCSIFWSVSVEQMDDLMLVAKLDHVYLHFIQISL